MNPRRKTVHVVSPHFDTNFKANLPGSGITILLDYTRRARVAPKGLFVIGRSKQHDTPESVSFIVSNRFHNKPTKTTSKINLELKACHSSLVILTYSEISVFFRDLAIKFEFKPKSVVCHQIEFKLKIDGESVTGQTDGRKRTDARTSKILSVPTQKAPSGQKNGFFSRRKMLNNQPI